VQVGEVTDAPIVMLTPEGGVTVERILYVCLCVCV
jgi:hypothetical protein